ncbi:MAG: hypothetical protein HQM10_26075 [Candidatus Riflebacteria bacterium]|nr:hypothetical protein [Candidatus Riflebacteria bacterium]
MKALDEYAANYTKLVEAWNLAKPHAKQELEESFRDNNNQGSGGWYKHAADLVVIDEIYAELGEQDPLLAKLILRRTGISLPKAANDNCDAILKMAVCNFTAQAARLLSYKQKTAEGPFAGTISEKTTGAEAVKYPRGEINIIDGWGNAPLGANSREHLIDVCDTWQLFLGRHPGVTKRLESLFPGFLGKMFSLATKPRGEAITEWRNLRDFVLAHNCHNGQSCELSTLDVSEVDLDVENDEKVPDVTVNSTEGSVKVKTTGSVTIENNSEDRP